MWDFENGCRGVRARPQHLLLMLSNEIARK